MKMSPKLLAGALLSLSSLSVYAVDDAVIESCNACHGADGVSQHTDIPTIAGIPEWNFADQMLQYQDGRHAETVNHVLGDTSLTGNMADIVDGLSEDDIDALAAYYAELPFVRATQDFDADLAAKGKALHDADCAMCHADGGADPEDEASILAGQQKGYMLRTLREYVEDKRDADASMVNALKDMTDEELVALAEYYASYQ